MNTDVNVLFELIKIIQTPQNNQETFRNAQRQLQSVQKSNEGWEVAKVLLSSPDNQAQFIGAQTFLVQLNERKNLPPLNVVQQDLIQSLQSCVQLGYSSFVTRKVVSAVAKQFMSSADWNDCPHLVLNILPLNLACEFFQFLIEYSELDTKIPNETLKNGIKQKLSVPCALLYKILDETDLKCKEAIEVYVSYCNYFFEEFKPLLPKLLNHLFIPEFVVDATSAVKELYQNFRRLWPVSYKKQLAVVFSNVQQVPADYVDDEAFLAVVGLIVDVCMEDFTEFTNMYPLLASLAGSPYHIVDDPLAFPILGFWNQYVEEAISGGMESSAIEFIKPVISSYWPRVKLYSELSNSDLNEFTGFRRDYTDFLELSYQLVGSEMFEHLTYVVLNSIEHANKVNNPDEIDWFSIENALYCLNSLSDIIGEDYKGDRPEFESIQRIFQSDLWLILPQCKNFRVKQTAVNAIGCFVDFFQTKEGQPFLATTLNYLFTCLESPSLQISASKSIQKLCRNCRDLLTNEIPVFLSVYERIRNYLEPLCNARTVSGIGYVIQAVPDLESKIQIITLLIRTIFTTEIIEFVDPSASESQNFTQAGISAGVNDQRELELVKLHCLAAAGKSLQDPDSISFEKAQALKSFYSSNELAISTHNELEGIVYSCLQSDDPEIIDSVCEIIKTGIPEPAGVFVFSKSFIIEFIRQKSLICTPDTSIPILELAKFLVCTQLSGQKSRQTTGLDDTELCILIGILYNRRGETSAALDVLTEIQRTCNYRGIQITSLQGALEMIVGVAIPSAGSSDRFILRSASTFLKEFLSVRVEISPVICENLMATLLNQISGNASRSDLTYTVDIFKLFISCHQLQATVWLKKYLIDDPLNEVIGSQELKTRTDFVSQVLLLKGSSRTQQIILKFWLLCRGIPETYEPIK
ncbi:hypothetical protein DASB73_017300 [Starmerella bacillaris]|uniref:Uncharacterized protein n=1 Tax=Starmerella bacillaris TaxID=1247836 RepID=A0AAV5RI48_STABA|nr:hypothetical protein DASB73_017300 [Starmerella bacillaris]